MSASRCNVADRLASAAAAAEPGRIAVVARTSRGERTTTFAALEADAAALARGLVELGVRPGTRLALLVPPSPQFVALVFALLRSGATTILIDPGMGGANLVRCLAAAEPEGFVAVSRAHAVRTVMRRLFPKATLNVTVGRRWFWGGVTYEQLLKRGRARIMKATGSAGGPRAKTPQTHESPPVEPVAFGPTTCGDDPAAIIFTSGSTGPAKGVLYTHQMFETQAAEIQRAYDIQPGGVDLSCFALFGLFNAAWGVTTVFPRMDFSRPASAEPRELLAAANEWQATQAFASPAVWDKLSRHCEQAGDRIPSLRKVFSCGAPVHADVLRRTLAHVVGAGAQIHTPYGATEALPVSTIEAREALVETAALTSKGAGVCVGRKFDSIEWRVIAISDEPMASIEEAEELPQGEIGELIVRGPQVSTAYDSLKNDWRTGSLSPPPGDESNLNRQGAYTARSPNALAKIRDGDTVWHRMGDVGYLDAKGRFWYCGRKAHRVETGANTLFTECVEAVFNKHPDIRVAALVRLGREGEQTPMVAVRFNDHCIIARTAGRGAFRDFDEMVRRAMPEERITDWVDFADFPVDVRHNSKIDRERLRAMIIDSVFLFPDAFAPEIVCAANHDYQFMAKEVAVRRSRRTRDLG